MSFSWLSTSTVLLIVLVVVLLRSARSLDRRRRPVVVAEVPVRDPAERTAPAFPRDHVLLRQRTDMTSTPSPRGVTENSTAEHRSSGRVRVPRPAARTASVAPAPAPRIRWDRTAAALVSVAAVVVGLLTTVLAPFTAVPWTVPVFLLLLGLGGLAALRYLAVTDVVAGRRPARPASAHSASQRVSRGSAQDSLTDRDAAARSTAPAEASAAPASTEVASESSRPTAEDARRSASKASDDRASGVRAAVYDQQDPEQAAADARRAEERLLQAGPLDLEALETAERPAPVPAVGEEPETGEPEVSSETDGTARLVMDKEMLREQARRVALGRPTGFRAKDDTWAPVQVPRPTYMDAPEAPRAAPAPLVLEEPRSSSSSLAEAAAKGAARQLDLDDVLSRRRA